MLKKDFEDLYENGKKGDWAFNSSDTYLAIMYGEEAYTGTVIIPISEHPSPRDWKWNGNVDAPTVSPSILVHGNEITVGWHGYMRGGVLMEA